MFRHRFVPAIAYIAAVLWLQGCIHANDDNSDSATSDSADTADSAMETDTDSGQLTTCDTRIDSVAGEFVVNRDAPGGGQCINKTMGEILDQAQMSNPDLLAIVFSIAPSDSLSHFGNIVYPFIDEDGGFAFVFRHSWGDICDMGCTNHTWFYFKTDTTCTPREVGRYIMNLNLDQDCYDISGAGMWGHPGRTDPAEICNLDTAANDISGKYILSGIGERSSCDTQDVELLGQTLTMTITQNPTDLSTGTVHLEGLDHPLLSEPLPAQFTGYRLSVRVNHDALSDNCTGEYFTLFSYDFDCWYENRLLMIEPAKCVDTECSQCCNGHISLFFDE